MTKSLTEQWKDGELERGLYYIRSKSGRECVAIHSGSQSFMFSSNDKYACQVKEVLAPVPSYDEYKELVSKTDKLEKKLAIATTALKYINAFKGWQRCECEKCADNALKEMKGVK